MSINFIDPYTGKPLLKSETGLMDGNIAAFPYKNGAYRIVADNNYTQNFGYQWNKFAPTQIDSAVPKHLSNVNMLHTFHMFSPEYTQRQSIHRYKILTYE